MLPNIFKRINIICGHYGSGKTNIAINFALRLKEEGENVTLIDLDIVNPYFRADDFKDMLSDNGIKLISPLFSNTNVEMMTLSPKVQSVFAEKDTTVIFDVGGDDSGAVALGRYHDFFMRDDTRLFCVINQKRPITEDEIGTAEILTDIESASRLRCDFLINNTNLSYDTDLSTVLNSKSFLEKVKSETKIENSITTLKRDLYEKLEDKKDFFPIDIYTKTIF